MTPRNRLNTLLLSAAALTFAAQGAAQGPEWTAGPLTICGNEAVVVSMFNPYEYTIKKVNVWNSKTGDLVDSGFASIPAGGGAAVAVTRESLQVDPRTADLEKNAAYGDPTECAERLVEFTQSETKTAANTGPVVYGGRFLSARDLRSVQFGFAAFDDAGTATSQPLYLPAEAAPIVRIANLGTAAAGVTVELVDALDGTVVHSATAYLTANDPTVRRIGGFFTECSGIGSEHGSAESPFVVRVTAAPPTPMRDGGSLDLAVSARVQAGRIQAGRVQAR